MSAGQKIVIKGMGALSALGDDMGSHREGILHGRVPFRLLGELLGQDSPYANRPGGWIENRTLLNHRKWSPATMAALHVAAQAVDDSGWSEDELKDTALVVGTSRGNAAGWLNDWPTRRPFKLMAASNSMHSEALSAISIEFQILGPNHMVASGCAAGLDAVGIAMMMVHSGQAERALVVAVDLPLVPILLDQYDMSGVLSEDLHTDPYAAGSDGFIPAEGAAAMAIELGDAQGVCLSHYCCNSDGVDPVGIPSNGGRSFDLLHAYLKCGDSPVAVCPHATGTSVQAVADPAVMDRAFPDHKPSLHLMKPYVGHTIGASGLLESVMVAEFLRCGELPPNLKGLHAPLGYELPAKVRPATGSVAKLSHAMGGHNALLVMDPAMAQ